MKMVVLLTLVLSIGLSCKNNESHTTSGQSELNIEEAGLVQPNEVALTKSYDYAEDWQVFKQAAKTKNKTELANLCTEKITDFEGLTFLLSEFYIIRALDQTPFTGLNTVDMDGNSYLQFYAEEIYLEDGYEYGTSLTLLFLKTDSGLRLDQYFAAG